MYGSPVPNLRRRCWDHTNGWMWPQRWHTALNPLGTASHYLKKSQKLCINSFVFRCKIIKINCFNLLRTIVKKRITSCSSNWLSAIAEAVFQKFSSENQYFLFWMPELNCCAFVCSLLYAFVVALEVWPVSNNYSMNIFINKIPFLKTRGST